MAERDRFMIPENIQVDKSSYSGSYGKFTLTPFERGWGTTIGNAYRRILISSIEGAAIVAVRVNEYLNEFASIPGVVEDVIDILLNLRHLPIRLHTRSTKRLYLRAETLGAVTAGLIDHDADVEIVDPNHYICTLGDKGSIELEMIVKVGRGFVPAERNQDPDLPRGFIPVASLHSPVRKVNIKVDSERVGRLTEYERLTLEIWTNHTITPVQALHEASDLLKKHTALFDALEEVVIKEPEKEVELQPVRVDTEEPTIKLTLDALGLDARLVKVLEGHQIKTIQELTQHSRQELAKLQAVGPKSIDKIIQKLKEHGYQLKNDNKDQGTEP